ncbi:hypothetical protein GGQ68_003013 [Sagittula marina]|uniref:Uncharacterized protein n=1 Tax=Sagittula marina TaxID=943940 RepID=A0A7W6DU24_9RHOB|nr:hypothetical protein [Sagittula marina]MBB3986670.1 hypothetical protein [Sagittula marina]
MKLITLIQAGALLMLAVFGAYASTAQNASHHCSGSQTEAVCEL